MDDFLPIVDVCDECEVCGECDGCLVSVRDRCLEGGGCDRVGVVRERCLLR